MMQGQVCLVTGATSGIGRVTAQEIARLGATVVVVGRDEQKGRSVISDIVQQTGNPNVELMVADLSVQQEIYRLADEFKQHHRQLHVLVNNAGAIFDQRRESQDGLEMTFALNHMGYFLLTNLLLDVIKDSSPARIINVSSDAHRAARIDFDDLQGEKKYSGFGAYAQSKLANLLFTYELAARLEGTGVAVNAVHPGFVNSGFGTNNGRGWKLFKRLLAPFSLSPQEGAQTSIYLATRPEVEGSTGKYFAKKRPIQSSKVSYDQKVARRLWQVSQDLIRVAA